jgi:hypothetical protein
MRYFLAERGFARNSVWPSQKRAAATIETWPTLRPWQSNAFIARPSSMTIFLASTTPPPAAENRLSTPLLASRWQSWRETRSSSWRLKLSPERAPQRPLGLLPC